jgi:dephospho-CoA kinase
MRIALTGGIACGKSLVAKFFNELGVQTLDADDVVHDLEAPGGAAVDAIVARFGRSVLAPDGGIDRKRLAGLVFGPETRDARNDLEAILHPLVRQRLLDFVRNMSTNATTSPTANTYHLKLSVIPLLFESHFESDYDIILCVSSTEDQQIDRMMRTRGYTREQAEARLAAQMPVAEKAARADWTIHNDSTIEKLKADVRRCVAWLFGRMEKAI